ncbi:MAG: hypothetical protein FWF92_00210 [Oscillospiraceae bacterium]|nr:hypothetical protein [Oscillospiraceae bacterium]
MSKFESNETTDSPPQSKTDLKIIKSAVMITLFVYIIAIPLILLFIIGEAPHDLDGEKDYELPGFSISTFFIGKFQKDFENWFSTKYPLRPEIVEIYGVLDAKKDSVNINFLKVPPDNIIEPPEEEPEEEPEEIIIIEPRFPEYNLPQEILYDPDGYRGTEHVIIGKNGCLYENGYINEYYGYAQKYINVTDIELKSRVKILKEIQNELALRDIAFCVAISPSKASAMPDYIPDWYIAQNKTISEDYIRPYLRFVDFLKEAEVYFVDSSALYKSLGLTNTFPKTGIHWNKFASFETCVAIIAEYERQTGEEIKHLAADEIRFSQNPPGFGNPEMDIFGIVYSGKKKEKQNAIVDEKYYWHDAYTSNTGKPAIKHMLIQGGSFTGDFYHYFGSFGIASEMSGYYYNNGGDIDINWKHEIDKTKFVLLEVNEQFIYNIGGNAPSWGQNDIVILDLGPNIIDSLWEYLIFNSVK